MAHKYRKFFPLLLPLALVLALAAIFGVPFFTDEPAPFDSGERSQSSDPHDTTSPKADGVSVIPSPPPADAPQPDADINASDQCAQAATVIKSFYTHLDQRGYPASFAVTTPSEEHFTQLARTLLNAPPAVSRETDDLFTILHNTAHFLRTIGKNNTLLIKTLLDAERDSFEKVLANLYTLTTIPGCPQNSFDLSIPQDALYEYAGFFLNTMGGRLYLFRRDSALRMAVSYYAVLIVNEANTKGSNRHGIPLLSPINALIAEISSAGHQLEFREIYLNTLHDLQERYQYIEGALKN